MNSIISAELIVPNRFAWFYRAHHYRLQLDLIACNPEDYVYIKMLAKRYVVDSPKKRKRSRFMYFDPDSCENIMERKAFCNDNANLFVYYCYIFCIESYHFIYV